MRHVFLVVISLCCALIGCDNSPPKPRADEVAPAVKSASVVERLINKLPSSAEVSEAHTREMAAQLQRHSYQLLAQGKFALSCNKQVDGNAFEQAVCRQQARTHGDYVSLMPVLKTKRSTVLNSREQQQNPWQWSVASETCWSADCSEAKHLRDVSKRCGSPVPKALAGECLAAGEVW